MDYTAYTQNHQQQQRTHDQASYPNSSQMQSYYQYPYTTDPYQHQQQQYSSYVYPHGYTDYNHQQGQLPGISASSHLHTQQDYYYPQEYYVGKHNSGLGSDPPAGGGSNSVNVNVSHQPTHQPDGHFPYRGKGRRGGRPFRGAGRGSLTHSKAHGGGHLSSHGAASVTRKAATIDAGSIVQPTSTSAAGQAPGPTPSQQPVAPPQPSRLAWCELCRVECNTELILEQHKNGKRHKKNLKVQAELQTIQKQINGEPNVPMPMSETQSKAETTEEIQTELKGPPVEADYGESGKDSESEKDAGKKIEAARAEPAVENGLESKEHLETRLPSKRKMKSGRGGKYIRTNAGLRRAVEPSAIPFFCELCNVKCESLAVIDSHFAGKKHQSNLKRAHGHLAGNLGLQALYPTNVNSASTSIAPQADPQVLLAQVIMNYVLSQTQGTQPANPHGPAPDFAPPQASMSTLGLTIHPQEGSQVQGLQSASEAGNHSGVSFAASMLQSSASIDPHARHVTGTETSLVEAKEKTVDCSDMMQSDNMGAGAEQVLSIASTSLSVTAVDIPSEHVVPASDESNVPQLLQDA